MKRRTLTPAELEHQNGQRAEFTCGLCTFTFTGRLDEWLQVRADHRAEAHPEFRERRRHTRQIPGAKREAYMTEREMERAA